MDCPPGQKSGRCGEVAISGGSTVYQTRGRVFKSDIQTLRSRFKKRGAAEFF